MINVEKLHKELKDAGIKISGCNSKGIVWDESNNEIQDREDVKAVMVRHDPALIPEETLDEKIERIVSDKLAKTKGQL